MVALEHALAALRDRAEIHALRGELNLAHHDLEAIRELRGDGLNRPARRVKATLWQRNAYRLPNRKSCYITGLGRAPEVEWFLHFRPMKARLQNLQPTRSIT
jgi:hypothetical protein